MLLTADSPDAAFVQTLLSLSMQLAEDGRYRAKRDWICAQLSSLGFKHG
jgi:hypothetical protein